MWRYQERFSSKSVKVSSSLKKELVSILVRPYSRTGREPNLLEPAALALTRKRVQQFVQKRSRAECAVILYHLWRDPQAMEERVRELSK